MKLSSPVTVGLLCGLVLGWGAYPHLAFESRQQPLQFSHRAHTGDEVQMACLDCHATDDHRTIGIPAVELCAGCHESAITDHPDEARLVEDYVVPGREIDWLVYARQPAGVRFSHAPHVVLAEIACDECHGDHGSSDALPAHSVNRISTYPRSLWGRDALGPDIGPRGLDMGDCDGCHRDRGVVDSCLDCHR
jgi:hypothetical protein